MHVTESQDVTARKTHRCWWCGEPIEKGDTYCKWACMDGGTVATIKVHPECRDAWYSLPPIDAEEVGFAEFSRGCTCERGRCECQLAEAEERDNPATQPPAIPECGFVCVCCAKRLGGRWPTGHLATHHEGTCTVCGEEQVVCNVGDYDWPDHKSRGMRD